eukprot:Protomagalhaensia_sp_Gyna_25__2687@NODE_2538_length_1027_cov_270_970648_g2106_i0_p1_GENE_NODE_2538_length_1027_cov_270_970648_g2106_i0NODE_2538_length_1027_cov_270_970648_g2106_i0_p1_ORF_typecomplete_len159_score5_59His_Phos_1/PF00300_22/3_8e15_NODE_2538_length_1027_cov_270_970648_g2106_i093569
MLVTYKVSLNCLEEANNPPGLRLKEIHAHYPHAYEQWAHVKDESYVFPNGESVIQRSRRVINALEGLARKNIGKRVVVFTHGGVLRDTLRRCLQVEYAHTPKVPLLNGGVHAIRICPDTHKWTLIYWNGIDIPALMNATRNRSSDEKPPELSIHAGVI